MRSSTSSSDRRYLLAALLTFVGLVGAWELLLRANAGATVEFELKRPKLSVTSSAGEKWIVFGNCLVMTGISPKLLDHELGAGRPRVIINIAAHEQSPIAFFNYLRSAEQYPDVIIFNVSSWINSTNFDQESKFVMQSDPLGFGTKDKVTAKRAQQAFRDNDDLGTGSVQKHIEERLARLLGDHVQAIGHRYHLFDYSMFLGTLATTGDLDNALYQLNIQSWFRVQSSDTDGLGWLGVHVSYRSDWDSGVAQMANRYLKRMRLSRLLTETYWTELESSIRTFQQHGTRVVMVRMPEYPAIREFNDKTYAIPQRLHDLSARTGAPLIDLSDLGPSDGVHLFDAVHPDADAADVITRKLAEWLRQTRQTR